MVQGKQLRARITSGSNFKPESLSRRPCFKGSFLAGCSACPCPSPVPTSHRHNLGSTGRSGMRSQGEGRHGRRQTPRIPNRIGILCEAEAGTGRRASTAPAACPTAQAPSAASRWQGQEGFKSQLAAGAPAPELFNARQQTHAVPQLALALPCNIRGSYLETKPPQHHASPPRPLRQRR